MMIKTRKKQVVLLLMSLLLVLALAACSSAAASSPSGLSLSNISTVATASPVSASSDPTQTVAPAAKLNLNTATAQDFLALPSVGDRMVNEFLEYRPYTTILQFEREIGKYVSADQVAAYEQYVYVPISANDSDAATLQQIPGLDESEATALISGRPYASNDAFLSALAQYVSADQLTVAQSYLSGQ